MSKNPRESTQKITDQFFATKRAECGGSIAAPISMIKTIEVVFAVSIITPSMVFSILNVRQPLHMTAIRRTTVAILARTTANISSALSIFLMLIS
ncbi:MAG: hypothetical protein CM1200mP20_14720 [Pseudomonadota bacterium]|nr:MAG: hypothetical protein CM1200mP20_14720 [Pseudomonadota bacterium]